MPVAALATQRVPLNAPMLAVCYVQGGPKRMHDFQKLIKNQRVGRFQQILRHMIHLRYKKLVLKFQYNPISHAREIISQSRGTRKTQIPFFHFLTHAAKVHESASAVQFSTRGSSAGWLPSFFELSVVFPLFSGVWITIFQPLFLL